MRDLQKDLEICEKATPGVWIPTLGSGINLCTSIYAEIPHTAGDLIFIADLLPDYVLKENILTAVNHVPNLDFIIEAREGWPEAIKRAIEAEAKVKELEQRCESCFNRD